MNNARVIYIRNDRNRHFKADGSMSRGDPEAVVVSVVDFDAALIKYAIATVHKSDHFIRSRARHIAIERLHTIDPNNVDQTLPNDRGILFGEYVREVLNTKSGHSITRLIMEEVLYLSSLPTNIRRVPTKIGKLASKWLKSAGVSRLANDERPTIPSPAKHRDAINPPPPIGPALTYPLPRS